jgi:hypothetical protein
VYQRVNTSAMRRTNRLIHRQCGVVVMFWLVIAATPAIAQDVYSRTIRLDRGDRRKPMRFSRATDAAGDMRNHVCRNVVGARGRTPFEVDSGCAEQRK